MTRRPRLADLQAEAERRERHDQYVEGLERENAIIDRQLGGPVQPRQKEGTAAERFMQRTARQARQEAEQAVRANREAHENPDPGVFDPLAELHAQQRERKRYRKRHAAALATRRGR